MKKLYKLTMLLLLMAWSTNLMATDYTVSDAGNPDANGTYAPDGTNSQGAPRWKHSGVVLLISLAAGYGGKKVYDFKKRSMID